MGTRGDRSWCAAVSPGQSFVVSAAGVSGLQMLCKCCMSHWGCSEQTCCVGVQPQEGFTPP